MRNWTAEEINKSSTWRELTGVALALEAFSPELKGKQVTVFTDNTGVEAIMRKGSMKPELQNIAMHIVELCATSDIVIKVQWVPKAQNVRADELSRQEDFDDWGVSHEFFRFMDMQWCPHTVDRFADEYNHKVAVFNAKFWSPRCSGVDAFAWDWGNDMNWLVPPISLVGKAIKHVKACKAVATLVVPSWPSAPLWPLLFSQRSSFSFMVVECMRFTDPRFIFIQGRNPNSCL